MCSKRDAIIFLAGAQTFHTISHIFLMFSNTLPISAFGITITPEINYAATIFNAVTAAALVWWAMRIPKEAKSFWKWW
jgi:hypothetical protein